MEIKQKLLYLKKNKLSIFSQLLKYLGISILLFAINSIKIFGSISPFGFALTFSLIYSGFNPLILGGVFGITFYLSSLSSMSIKVGLVVIFICLILTIINKFKKSKLSSGLSYVLCFIAYLTYIYLNLSSAKQNAMLVIGLIFSLFFLYILNSFFKGTIKRGFSAKLNPDEKICGAIILLIFAYGACSINYFDINFATIICVLISLISAYTFSSIETITISFIFGLGVSISTFNPLFISKYICFGVLACAFKNSSKIFSAISQIIVYVFFTIYFSDSFVFSIPTLIGILIVCIIFIVLPKKLINYIKDVFAGYKDKLAMRNMIKTSKDKIKRKLIDVSNVFREMEFSFMRTLQKTLPLTEKKEIIKQEIVDKVCKDCSNFNKCMRINGDYTTKVFDSIVDAGVAKGKVEAIDVNNYIYTRCPKLSLLVNESNEIIRAYREYNIMSNNMDCSKVLVAEQFKGMGKLIRELAKDIGGEFNFDISLETRIIEDLLYKNIFVEEAVVYDKSINEKEVVLLVKNTKFSHQILENLVSKILKCKVKIVSIEPSELPNMSVIYLNTCPNFDVVFGSATCNKAGTIVSGDTHSFIKIDNGKYMLALSDGMGSGVLARETSDLSISLIENYYKAGFDNAMILSSVNKLLSLNSEEMFSAIDLCILDFFKNTMDFIKLGTPNSYIKRKTGVEVINSSGLPIGILEEIRPHITKKYINNFDTIIIVSDGVADSFKNVNFQVFINNLNIINPQDLAETILTKAKALAHNVCEDDMTVLVARIFPTK